jgi:hypothetical protein
MGQGLGFSDGEEEDHLRMKFPFFEFTAASVPAMSFEVILMP